MDVAEYLDVPEPQDGVLITDAEDGGAYVDMPGESSEKAPPDPAFYANLAVDLPDMVKSRIVSDLLRRIEEDKEARSQRDKQYAEGLRRTGLGDDAPGGAEFEGASKVVHPMMTEACIDYASRIMREIFPPSGPVKPKIIGKPTAEKAALAGRITDHLNYQFTTQIKEARSVLETTLTQVPLGGSQFIHLWQDHRLKRQRMEFRSVDKMHIPFTAADFASAHRKTYADTITAVEFRHRVDSGLYVSTVTTPPAQLDEPTKAEKANRKIEGIEDASQNLDGDRDIYETMTYLEVSEEAAPFLDREVEGGLYPYMITMDVSSSEMLSMYRCWEDGDQAHEPIEHDFEFPFIPWRGALSIGFPQIIGGLSAAATGALRALLDSALIANTQGGLIMKGSGTNAQTVRPQIATFTNIDIGLETDDIRKKVLPYSQTQPSAVLLELLGFVVNAAKEIVRTSLDESPTDGNTNVPVGTQLSRVEEGLVVFSAIHGRAHAAMNRLIAGMYRLNRLYMPDSLKVDLSGKEVLVSRADYEGPCQVQPVSDPTIYSDQQRFAQIAFIQQRMQVVPQLYKAREVELAALKLIRWADPESLLVDAPTPHELNQVNENLAMVMGGPVSVFPDQDHMAHLKVLIDFMRSPVLGMNPIIAKTFLPHAIQHAAQHIAFLYVESTVTTIKQAANEDPADLMSDDPEIKRKFDELLVAASAATVPKIEAMLQEAMQVLQQAQQLLQSMMPPPPMDPAQAAVQAAAAETQRRGAADQSNTQIKQAQNAIAADRVQATREATATNAQVKLATTQADNRTAEEIAAQRTGGGMPPGFVDGASMTH